MFYQVEYLQIIQLNQCLWTIQINDKVFVR